MERRHQPRSIQILSCSATSEGMAGGGGWSAVALASYCQAQTVHRSRGHSGREKVRMAEPTPQDRPKPRRLRLQKQMYMKRAELGWSSVSRHQLGQRDLTVESHSFKHVLMVTLTLWY